MKQVTGKQFARILQRHGWALDRTKGSHYIYKKPGEFATVTVPIHGNQDLRTGTLASLLKATGLTENDL